PGVRRCASGRAQRLMVALPLKRARQRKACDRNRHRNHSATATAASSSRGRRVDVEHSGSIVAAKRGISTAAGRGAPHDCSRTRRMRESKRVPELVTRHLRHIRGDPEKAIHSFVEDQVGVNQTLEGLTAYDLCLSRIPDGGLRKHSAATNRRGQLFATIRTRGYIRVFERLSAG